MALSTTSRTSYDQINSDFFLNIESNETPKVLPVARKSVEQEALLSHLSIGNDAYGKEVREAECDRFLSDLCSRLSNRDNIPRKSDEEITAWTLRIKELARGYPRSGPCTYKGLCRRVGYAIGAYGEGEDEEESESGGRKLKSKRFLRLEAGKADPDAYSDPLMKDFCKEFNQRTAQLSGDDLGVIVKKYDDGTFSFTFGPFTPIPTGLP